jgi:osmotically-inducible protein OsmY
MNLVSRVFGNKYNDGQIVSHAKNAIAEDPLVADAAALNVASQKGVVTLTGSVHRKQERDRIEGVVRGALKSAGLKYERIVNELKVSG